MQGTITFAGGMDAMVLWATQGMRAYGEMNFQSQTGLPLISATPSLSLRFLSFQREWNSLMFSIAVRLAAEAHFLKHRTVLSKSQCLGTGSLCKIKFYIDSNTELDTQRGFQRLAQWITRYKENTDLVRQVLLLNKIH